MIYDLVIQREKGLLAIIQGKNKVELWNYREKSLLMYYEENSKVNGIDLYNNHLTIALSDGSIQLINTETDNDKISLSVSANPLIKIKEVDNQNLVTLDSKGNMFFVGIDSTLSVKKQIITSKRINSMDVIPEKNILITGDNKGEVCLWSIENYQLLNTDIIHKKRIFFNITYFPENQNILFSTDHGEIIQCKLNGLQLFVMNIFRIEGWATDCDMKNNIIAAGSSNGSVKIFYDFGVYKYKTKAMVNKIAIIPDNFPYFQIALATHGSGLLIISSMDMKNKSNF